MNDRCAERVYGSHHGFHGSQCTRKSGHGPGGKYCKQHDPASVKARREKSRERYDKIYEDMQARVKRQQAINSAYANAIATLRDIADGCENPADRAKAAISTFDEAKGGQQ